MLEMQSWNYLFRPNMWSAIVMAGFVLAALVVGIYLSISMGEDETPVFADDSSDWRSAPSER